MNSNAHFPESEAAPTHSRSSGGRLREPILAAVVSWVLIGLGFLALKVLMHERPQFTGQPLRVSKVHLVQRAPSLVLRKASDDVSAVKTGQPARAEAEFEVRGRRDYRGLRTILDMSGRFNGRYWLTNRIEEPAYYLFKCPHPATLESSAGGGFASGLKLESSKPGLVENVGDAW